MVVVLIINCAFAQNDTFYSLIALLFALTAALRDLMFLTGGIW